LEPFLGFLDWAYDDAGLRKLGPDLQPRDHQVEQAKPELGVLEIQLLESVIVDHRVWTSVLQRTVLVRLPSGVNRPISPSRVPFPKA